MIIAKPFDIDLLEKDLILEGHIGQFTKYSLSYASPNFPGENIGFIDCGTDRADFLNCVNWLNENNLAALMSYDEYGTKKISTPYHINSKLCVGFEGLYSKSEEFLKSLSEVEKTVDNFFDPDILWSIEESLTISDSLIFMDNLGKFTFLNKLNVFMENGINYCKFSRTYRGFNNQNQQNMMFDGYCEC
jgi:hypothetical protein